MKREWLVSFILLTSFLPVLPKAKERYRMPKRLVSYQRIVIERIRQHRLQREREQFRQTIEQMNRERLEDSIVRTRRELIQHLLLPQNVQPAIANESLAVRLIRAIRVEVTDQNRSIHISSRIVRSITGSDTSELCILGEELTQEEIVRVLQGAYGASRENV